MVGGLHQAHARRPPLLGPLHDGGHELPADGGVLDGRVDGDRTDAGDRDPFVEEVGTDHLAVGLGDDGEDARMGQQARHQAGGYLDGREVAGGAVGGCDGGEVVRISTRRIL